MFSIVAHLGNLLAPLLFILLNVSLKKALWSFLRSCRTAGAPSAAHNSKEMILDDMTLATTTMTTTATPAAGAPSSYSNQAMEHETA